jgi:uncharacterized membrane protein
MNLPSRKVTFHQLIKIYQYINISTVFLSIFLEDTMKVLLAGESWMVQQTHLKGFDYATLCRYEEYGKPLIDALESNGFSVKYMPSHIAQTDFPNSIEALKEFDAVILSDIGSNTLLLHPDTQFKCKRLPNRLAVLRDYVADGGGLLTFGGYMCYSGINNKARYGMTPLADAMPVTMLNYDDRMEHPEGIVPEIILTTHVVLRGIESEVWPDFLGYNRVIAKANTEVIATIGGDPLMACINYGKGRSFAFTTDCVPHWGTPEFVTWKGYKILFSNILRWLAKEF